MAGQIYRAIRRNPDAITALATLLAGGTAERERRKQYEDIVNLLTTTEIGPSREAEARAAALEGMPTIEAQPPSKREIRSDAGTMPVATVPQERVALTKRMRGISELTPEGLLRLGSLLKIPAGSAIELLAKQEEARRPKVTFAPAGAQPGRISPTGEWTPLGAPVPRADVSITGYEDFRAGGVRRKTAEEWEQARTKPEKPTSVWLGTEDVKDGGKTKKADIYGYYDETGKKVVTDRKYQDFSARPVDELTEELKTQRLEEGRRRATEGQKKTVQLSIYNPSRGMASKQVSGTKKQLTDLIRSEISSIEKVVPRLAASAGGRRTTASEILSWPTDVLGLTEPEKSWKTFIDDPKGSAVEELHPDIRGYALSYLDLKDKLESLEGEVELTKEARGGYTVQPPQSALDYLSQHKNDAEVIRQFKEKYGALPPGH